MLPTTDKKTALRVSWLDGHEFTEEVKRLATDGRVAALSMVRPMRHSFADAFTQMADENNIDGLRTLLKAQGAKESNPRVFERAFNHAARQDRAEVMRMLKPYISHAQALQNRIP